MKKLFVLIALIFALSCLGSCFASNGIPAVAPNTMVLEVNGSANTYELYTYQDNGDGTVYTMYVCTCGCGEATGFNIITYHDCGVYACADQYDLVGTFALLSEGETYMAECGPNGLNGSYLPMDMCVYVNEYGHYCGILFTNINGFDVKGMFDLTY